jgi:hypothetical protein
MQQLNDILREWRVVEAKARAAEDAVVRSAQAQKEGHGLGPAPSQVALAKQLRARAADLLMQLQRRSESLERAPGAMDRRIIPRSRTRLPRYRSDAVLLSFASTTTIFMT